jgi:hypothetical protein
MDTAAVKQMPIAVGVSLQLIVNKGFAWTMPFDRSAVA